MSQWIIFCLINTLTDWGMLASKILFTFTMWREEQISHPQSLVKTAWVQTIFTKLQGWLFCSSRHVVNINGIFDANIPQSVRVLIKRKTIHWVINCPDSNMNLACPLGKKNRQLSRRRGTRRWRAWYFSQTLPSIHPRFLSSVQIPIFSRKTNACRVWDWKPTARDFNFY